ncbi:RNA polymerase sigma-70 factor [Brevibacillus formosus]|uniref:RNA polymerase n=1 Tax=Brevibacillus formosus TaxID=54913 RepID=A0A837KI31_9BACL|nr:RNA polymerase sigma-70 factor [Brevibacillus formosus]KLH96711.1 RNA polymerase [Brevibacillus formosus]MED1960139.1 RNA polymerase sigma-70 factor [Brevibacillus formosus]PSJ99298.1 RNA polymerase sigma-70 factor [Brevibacillus formosus]GED61313.1 RNA polymerase sigma factor SigJ [Brevibacillus formosus]
MTVRMGDVYREYKSLLFSLAYRMTGSVTEAEDIVQDTFLALAGTDIQDIHHVKSYLCKAVTNRCLDLLKSARWKREQYVGEWLPEPVVDASATNDPLHTVIAEESVSYGLLVLLENLSPPERAVYVLRTALDYEYSEIAAMLEKTEAGCRKLFSRAGQKLREAGYQGAAPQSNRSTRLVEQLIHAISQSDARALIGLLTNDSVLVSDGGGKVRAALRPIFSDERIAAFWMGVWPRWASRATMQIRSINGQDGIAVFSEGELKMIIQITMNEEEERIKHMYMMVNPDKLAHLQK